jgi:hypothetical protein
MGNPSTGNEDLATEAEKNDSLPAGVDPGRDKKRPAEEQQRERDKNDVAEPAQRRKPSPSDLFNGS